MYQNLKQYLALFTLFILLGVSAYSEPKTIRERLGSAELDKKIAGTTLQPVEHLDPSVLSVVPNGNLAGIPANIPGWNVNDPAASDMKVLLELFGIKTTDQKPPYAPGAELVYFSKGVGRSGILEKDTPGDFFLKHNGVLYKGLTIKGYGGNLGHYRGLQPNGTLDVSEAVRDTLLSSIMLENGIDAYIGALHVVRPGGQTNFVRLSRTAYRMNDLSGRTGADLRQTVDFLTHQLADETGKHLNPSEFYDWLVTKSAQVVAGKDYIRFKHGSVTIDNVGVGEMVDFGEGTYWGSEESRPKKDSWDTGVPVQKSEFKEHIKAAADNIAKEYGLNKNFDASFEPAYDSQFQAMKSKDDQRVNLAVADGTALKNIGLSDPAVQALLAAQKAKDFGLLTREEAMALNGVGPADKEIIWNRTRTHFTTLSGNRMLPSALIKTLGGAEGVREVLTKLATAVASGKVDINNGAAVETFLKAEVDAALKAKGPHGSSFSSYESFSPKVHLVRSAKFYTEQAKASGGLSCASIMKAVAAGKP